MQEIIEPALPIIDPPPPLWDNQALLAHMPPPSHPFEEMLRRHPRYLLEELLIDTSGGHNVRATVYLECSSHYRTNGPLELRPVGETEYVAGVAALAAARGETRVCETIVSFAD